MLEMYVGKSVELDFQMTQVLLAPVEGGAWMQKLVLIPSERDEPENEYLSAEGRRRTGQLGGTPCKGR